MVWLYSIQGGSNMTGTQCGLFTHKSVPDIFESPCTYRIRSFRAGMAQSAINWVTRVRFPTGDEIFLFAITSRLTLVLAQPRIQRRGEGALCPGPGCRLVNPNNHPSLVRMLRCVQQFISTPPIRLHGVVLKRIW
jgi:hypothetical protein